jgi:large subunit ribosomal protein L29
MDIKELRKLNMKELEEKASTLSTEMSKLYLELNSGKSKNVAKLKAMRKDLARVKTIISELRIINEK